jgi:hypothetical protein
MFARAVGHINAGTRLEPKPGIKSSPNIGSGKSGSCAQDGVDVRFVVTLLAILCMTPITLLFVFAVGK